MSESCRDGNCDLVLAMEDAGVGVEEILQFAKGCLSQDDVRTLVARLESFLDLDGPEATEVVTDFETVRHI
jgi:hypothetical protein